jgi:hypothetical protein
VGGVECDRIFENVFYGVAKGAGANHRRKKLKTPDEPDDPSPSMRHKGPRGLMSASRRRVGLDSAASFAA